MRIEIKYVHTVLIVISKFALVDNGHCVPMKISMASL